MAQRERYIYKIDHDDNHYFGGFNLDGTPIWVAHLKDAETYANKGLADDDYEVLKSLGFAVIVE